LLNNTLKKDAYLEVNTRLKQMAHNYYKFCDVKNCVLYDEIARFIN
jgi:hypothetical protein